MEAENEEDEQSLLRERKNARDVSYTLCELLNKQHDISGSQLSLLIKSTFFFFSLVRLKQHLMNSRTAKVKQQSISFNQFTKIYESAHHRLH